MKLGVGRGLVRVGKSTERKLGGWLEGPRRAQGSCMSLSFRVKMEENLLLPNYSRRLGTEQTDWKIGKGKKSLKNSKSENTRC